MKIIRIAGSIAAAAITAALSGCVATLGAPGAGVTIGVPAPVFTTVPAPGPVAAEWYFDGANYYFFDAAYGQYFYYGAGGEVIFLDRGWRPNPGWHNYGRAPYAPVFRGGHPVHGGWHR
jgi:hypothetical protein